MKPWESLGETHTPDGTTIALKRRDTEYLLLANGETLMSNRLHESEDALAALVCERLKGRPAPVVLIGGLGMGFTLRAALDRLPRQATVVVAELLSLVVDWNRGPLGPLAGHPLDDPRVTLVTGDVSTVLRTSAARFDAVLLDVDNGPEAFASGANARLYGDIGLFAIRTALKLGGILGVWSVWKDKHFPARLRFAGFEVETTSVKGRVKRGGDRHVIYLATNGAP